MSALRLAGSIGRPPPSRANRHLASQKQKRGRHSSHSRTTALGRLLPGSRRQSPSAEQRHARQAFRLLRKPVAADKDAPIGMLAVRTVEAQRAAATERNRP